MQVQSFSETYTSVWMNLRCLPKCKTNETGGKGEGIWVSQRTRKQQPLRRGKAANRRHQRKREIRYGIFSTSAVCQAPWYDLTLHKLISFSPFPETDIISIFKAENWVVQRRWWTFHEINSVDKNLMCSRKRHEGNQQAQHLSLEDTTCQGPR